jgi:hypothetical protein
MNTGLSGTFSFKRNAFKVSIITLLISLFFVSTACKKEQEPQTIQRQTETKNEDLNQGTKSQINAGSTTATSKTDPLSRFEQKNTREQVAFSVSADQIEAFINDSERGISFAPPRGFFPTTYNLLPSTDISTKFTKVSTPEYSVEPLYTFRKQENVVVASIDFGKSEQTYDTFLTKYENTIRERFIPANITKTFFMKGTIKITQFFIQEAERGMFRVIFPSQIEGKAFQFDYSIRRQTAQDNMQAIEPSIGTITYIPMKK